MSLSVFQMFKIGIGPSSSHTVGPMKAAKEFLLNAKQNNLFNNLDKIKSVKIDLFGSLALTGKGHGTDKAIIMGLMGEEPEFVDTSTIYKKINEITKIKKLKLLNGFDSETNFSIDFHKTGKLPYHSNGMRFILLDNENKEIFREIYYSTGGGFIINEKEIDENEKSKKNNYVKLTEKSVPYPFSTANELMYICKTEKRSIAEIVLANELTWRTEEEIKIKLDRIWEVMDNCIKRGIKANGYLPGPLKVERRANGIHENLITNTGEITDSMEYLNWINMWALAVSEENSMGGQVVTAPTNGSAGVIPSVLSYYKKFYEKKYPNKTYDFLLTAAAIGMIIKLNATISGAEGGCQAEIGASSSMAAAGLTAALNGNINQIENAAEIAMEHFIGMTCDPVGGMVQIPCIERNAVGAVKAVNSCAMALIEKNKHKVSLDNIVQVMKQTGDDMKTKYKETSKGGIAKVMQGDINESKKEMNKKGGSAKNKIEDVEMFVNETLC